jgi:hypothetical protein
MMAISNWLGLKIGILYTMGMQTRGQTQKLPAPEKFHRPSRKPFCGTSLPAPCICRECFFPSRDARYCGPWPLEPSIASARQLPKVLQTQMWFQTVIDRRADAAAVSAIVSGRST